MLNYEDFLVKTVGVKNSHENIVMHNKKNYFISCRTLRTTSQISYQNSKNLI